MISTGILKEEYRETILRFAISVGDRMETLIYDMTSYDKNELATRYNDYISINTIELEKLRLQRQKKLSENADSMNKFYAVREIEREIARYERELEENKKRLEYLRNMRPLAQKYVDFCKSFNFGESAKCYKIELTQERKDFFAKEGVFEDVGNLAIGSEELGPWDALEQYKGMIFEDIEVYRGDKKITEATSHEDYFAVELDDELETIFLDFENQRERNIAILKDLKRCACPQDLVGKRMKVTQDENKVVLNVDDGRKIVFDYSGYKHNVEYNGYSTSKADFVSGKEYILDKIDLYHNIQCFYAGLHSSLELCLKTDNDEYCDFVVDAEKIYVYIL